jgi:AraC-like DNA-binding protein
MTNLLLSIIIALLGVILGMVHFIIRKSIFEPSKSEISFRYNDDQVNGKAVDKQYAKCGISPKLAKEFKYRILDTMERGQHFLDPDFRLENLAQLVSLTKHQTSLVLNKEINMDFNSFINSLRIEKAKALLEQNVNMQISEVMYLVGYNNTSTFNRAFKKFTDLTPREYVYENVINSRT